MALPNTLSALSPLKLALLAQQVRQQNEPVLRADPIAIVGMGCRLPGGVEGPEDFWRLLRDGVDAVGEVPPGRWDVASLYDPDPAVPGKTATRWGGFLKEIDRFDAAFFGILPREAERMDPQQRLFLEVAVEAFDHAGLPREKLAGSRTGVFVASYYNDYAFLEYSDPQAIDARTLTGTVHSVLANRLSYLLDLRGPSISVDTACSSSLVAIHMACQSLRHGESDVAVAAGVSLMAHEGVMIALSKVGFMAPDGRCKTFDASADGFGRGEGCSVLVMKRLSDAVADGDRVLALVRGSAVNQDGRSTVLAAPNGLAQQALIRDALSNAQLQASEIGYVECHGTGTALGDPIEVEALALTVGKPAPGAGPCLIGAAKANLAHLEAAAGVTGVVKSVLVLQHEAIPPQVHFKQLNPHISLEGTRLQVPTQLTPWPRGSKPRLIGTSGFGVGGTNAHVILQEAPLLGAEPSTLDANAGPCMLPLSAQSEAALKALVQRWIDFLAQSQLPLHALCATAGERRSHYDHRLAAVAADKAEMAQRLRGFLDGMQGAGLATGQRRHGAPSRLAFVFGGQGQQWFAMGRQLLQNEPVFREAIEALDAAFARHAPWSLKAELLRDEAESRVADTEVAQPAIFAVQVGLAALWRHWGITPDGVVGHSIGELAALHVSGALSRDEAVRIVWQRAQAMQRATGQGAMAAVGLSEAQAIELLRPHGDALSIGAVNSPRGVVLSGQAQPLAQVLEQLAARGVAQRALPVNYAFHSTQMQPHADALAQSLGAVRGATPECPLYSTVTGALYESAPDAAYFARNVRSPVRFAAAVNAMLADGFDVFLEIGAHPVLASAIAECAAEQGQAVSLIASLRRARDDRETLLQACAGLYASGRNLDWERLQGAPAEVLDLPAYPWQRQRFWLRPTPVAQAAAAPAAGWPGRRLSTAGVTVVEGRWPDPSLGWLADHRVGGEIVMPGVGMMEALRLAAAQAVGGPVALCDFVVLQRLVLPEAHAAQALCWQAVVQPVRDGAASAALYAKAEGESEWRPVASAQATPAGAAEGPSWPDGHALQPVRMEAVYAAFAQLGVQFGPAFRTMTSLSVAADAEEAVARASLSAAPIEAAASGALHPGLLDGGLQACVCAAGGAEGLPTAALLPMAVERFAVQGPMVSAAHVQVRVRWAPGRASMSADLRWQDEQGRELARCEGVRFVKAELAAERPDPWLHQLRWHAAPPVAEPVVAPGRWLLLADAGGVAAEAARALEQQGQSCVLVHRHGVAGAQRSIDPADPHAIKALLADADPARPWRGAVHLWSLDLAPGAAVDLLTSVSGLHLVQAAADAGGMAAPVFVTRGAQPADGTVAHPQAAGLWGLHAAVAAEHPGLSARAIDLDPESLDAEALALELLQPDTAPRRLALRGARRLVQRLEPRAPLAAAKPLRLLPGRDGTLDSLQQQPVADVPLKPGDLRVRVVAAGLNFRDVLISLGMVPAGDMGLGAECAGVVEAVGSQVQGFAPGDLVFGFAPGALATQADVPAAFMAPWPNGLGTLEQAAALPAAYLTAMLGLQHLARLKRGQSVLVHAGTGGVGMAAVHLALRAGATVFATAGSPAKRERLRAMGVAQAFDSRTLDFSRQVLDATGGAGVDVVLNSLAGDFIGASVEALGARGCFLELGKRQLWTPEQFHRLRPEARYIVYDLGDAARADASIVRPMLDELVQALRDHSLPLLPVRVFGFDEAADAMRHMAQARHMGKLVLRSPGPAAPAPRIHAEASYLVTGGLGAIGLHTARWLVEQGARHLVLTGRSAPSAGAQAAMEAMAAQGARVRVAQVDAADAAAMKALFDDMAATMPVLRGVFHAAGQLDDGILMHQDAARFDRVLRGKAHGARVLDALTRDQVLDLFVLYSAAGLLLGPAGQGAYAAANAELDALAHARRAAGLPALSVAWGMWAEGGMAAAMQAAGRDSWSQRGLGWIAPADGMARLERLLREAAVHAAVMPMDWARFLASLPAQSGDAYFAALATAAPAPAAAPRGESASGSLLARWHALPVAQRAAAVRTHAAEQALSVLGLPSGTVLEPRTPLKEAGLDSLMAVELRNALTRSIGQALPATLLFDHPSLEALSAFLMKTLGLAEEETPAAAVDTAQAQREAIADEVAQLSDAEAEALLLAELDGNGRSDK